MSGVVARLAAVVLLALPPAHAAADDALYVARAFVTGQGEATRAAGFARALEDVLVKVSGDPRLIGDARVAALAGATLVAQFRYRDLLAGIPTHDEQGTRDRPYELSVGFDPARIDAALAALGRAPWRARPRVAVAVVVRTAAMAFTLEGDGTRGRDQRDALLDAAWRFGVPIALPSAGVPASGDATLSGELTWSAAALGWTGAWRLDEAGRSHRWRIGGVSFDDALRNAIGGAARILSGNGAPD